MILLDLAVLLQSFSTRCSRSLSSSNSVAILSNVLLLLGRERFRFSFSASR
jgi:hypothetical protein